MSASTATIIYLGLDVHKDSATIAVLPGDAAVPARVDRYPNDFAKLRRVFERPAQQGQRRACYAPSGAGNVLHRAMRDWCYRCGVIAPSLIPTKPGVQRRHDKYAAGQWARLYRAGALTVIRIPSEAESACAISYGAGRRCSAKSSNRGTTACDCGCQALMPGHAASAVLAEDSSRGRGSIALIRLKHPCPS